MKNVKKGDSSGYLKLQFVAKYQKKLKGGPFRDRKKIEKMSLNAEKNPIVSSGLVSYAKNGVDEGGTLCTKLDAFPFAGPVV